jgi:hypothetical protein
MVNQKNKNNSLKDEESDPNDLKGFIRKTNNRNKILQKLLNSINNSDKSKKGKLNHQHTINNKKSNQ